MLARCGRVAHICEANFIGIQFAICFPCCNRTFLNFPVRIWKIREKQRQKFKQGNGAIAARWQAKAGVEPPFSGRERPVFLREVTPRKTTCVRFGRIASLSAYVLFADEYVVRIADESFLDCSLQEVLLFLKWRTAFSHVPLRFQYHLIKTSVKEGSLPSLTIHLAELSQLDRSCLRLGFCNRSQSAQYSGNSPS